MTAPTYHDVVVTVNGVEYRLFDQPYGLTLTCHRSTGWELWESFGNPRRARRRLLGGEYNNDDFKITVAGTIICERTKE